MRVELDFIRVPVLGPVHCVIQGQGPCFIFGISENKLKHTIFIIAIYIIHASCHPCVYIVRYFVRMTRGCFGFAKNVIRYLYNFKAKY